MRYIDSGQRDPSQALGTWMKDLDPSTVAELRVQTGFFGITGIALLLPVLEQLRQEEGVTRFLIGSNDAGTPGADVRDLAAALGLPRANAQLAVCAFGTGFFHPKVVHLTLNDGHQAAYIGSANLTASGVLGQHVEAGVLLDTRDGDSEEELARIARAIDAWFDEHRPGLFPVADVSAVEPLVNQGVLAKAADPVETRPPSRKSASGNTPALPNLKPLLSVPAEAVGSGAVGPTKRPKTPTSSPTAATPGSTPGASTAAAWTLVWRSKGLVRRDLTIPTADNTHQTGSMLLKKGDWDDIDQRHYFRDEVFDTLAWTASKGTMEEAEASFEIVVHGTTVGTFTLGLSHNTDTTSRSYEQKNSMTSLRWGDARPHVAKAALLGSVMELWRAGPSGSRYRIVIRPA